jgi:V/A-type H+/Na+-transporting ATPase subunit E
VSVKSGVAAIADEVICDVQKEAEAIIASAENEAKETLREAKEKADKDYNLLLSEANQKSEAEKRKIASVTEVELRNRLLQAKESLVDEAFAKATEALKNYVETDEYPLHLLKLLTSIAKRMDQPVLVVEVNAKDKAILTEDALKKAGKTAETELKLSDASPNMIGGCRVQTEDGKIVYDATLDNRLEELKPELRAQIAKSLFGETSQ